MTALVTFLAAGQRYAVTVADAGAVLEPEQIEPLPDPLPDVLGIIRHGEDTVSVLAPFGSADGAHVLVVRAPAGALGLLVDEVTRVVRVPDDAVGPAPQGQGSGLVAGTVRTPALDALLLDPAALAARLLR